MKNLILLLIYSTLTFAAVAQKYRIITQGDLKGINDASGKLLIPLKYYEITPCAYSDNYFIGYKDGFANLINIEKNTTQALNEYYEDLPNEGDVCQLTENHFVRTIKGKKMGLMQFPDRVILPTTYSKIYPFESVKNVYLTVRGKDYQFYYLDKKMTSPLFRIKNAYMYFNFDNNKSYMNENETFPAEINGKWFLMKIDGTTFALEKFNEINFDLDGSETGMLLTKQNGKYGYMNRNGEMVIECKYDELTWFVDGLAKATLNGAPLWINPQGEKVEANE